jgi:hypothetical protein
MKTYINYLLILLLPFAAGCVKDHGNYHYETLPAVEILGIKTDTVFRVQQFDTLVLAPAIVATSEAGKAGFEHEWRINNRIVSTDSALRVEIHEAPTSAYYLASLRVTDKASGLRYYKNFRLTVTTPFSSGLFILSERADSTAVLSFQGRNKPDVPLMHDLFENVNPTFGSLGKQPRQLFHEGYQPQMGVICGGGQYPLTLLDPTTLALLRRHSKETIQGGYNGDFNPARAIIYMGGMIAGGGKLYSYNFMFNKSLYRPVPERDGEYEFADWVDAHSQLDAYGWVSYDNKSQRFILLQSGNDKLLYNRFTPIPVQDNHSTAGQRFLAGGKFDVANLRAILYNPTERKAYLYGLQLEEELDMSIFDYIIKPTLERFSVHDNLVDENSICFYSGEYWYLATGNTVRRLHQRGTATLDWFTAPHGAVTTMITDKPARRLFIATYDGAKSYIYAIDIATKQLLETPLEMDGKIVSMIAKGTWWDY